MIITSAHLINFRNHTRSEFEFGSSMNVFLGENGMGKTNVLEAISYLCLTKSFYASADSIVLQHTREHFEVSGVLKSKQDEIAQIRVAYDHGVARKKFTINRVEPESFSHVIGRFPIVVLSPENSAITFGAPNDRRKFVDLLIAQSSTAYTEDLIEYKRVVRQRNSILAGIDSTDSQKIESLEPWNEMLVERGSRIIQRRSKFIEEFVPYVERTYETLVPNAEEPRIRYAPSVSTYGGGKIDEIAQTFREKLTRKRSEELRLKTTLVGPQRDEYIFLMNDTLVKHYASQGQHKTLLVALKTAEFYFLKDHCDDIPVFLLDDVFSELDQNRSRNLLEMVDSLGQTFITTTNESVLGKAVSWGNERRRFIISHGAVNATATAA